MLHPVNKKVAELPKLQKYLIKSKFLIQKYRGVAIQARKYQLDWSATTKSVNYVLSHSFAKIRGLSKIVVQCIQDDFVLALEVAALGGLIYVLVLNSSALPSSVEQLKPGTHHPSTCFPPTMNTGPLNAKTQSHHSVCHHVILSTFAMRSYFPSNN